MTTNTVNTDNWKEIKEASEAALPEHIVKYIENCLKEDMPESQLISILHTVQSHFGYLGKEQMNAVAQLLQVPTAKVTGVATFYHFFRFKPRGRFMISVCMGTACYVKGADKVLQRLIDELGISVGETSKDGLFTLEASRCLGTCGLAPVIMINEEVHGPISPEDVPFIIQKYRKKAKKEKKK
jgi:NADH:ubiquinone oxidoreductase subunit E